jgi:hypothetical protein
MARKKSIRMVVGREHAEIRSEHKRHKRKMGSRMAKRGGGR